MNSASSNKSTTHLNLTNNFSNMPKNSTLDQKIAFIVKSIESAIDCYLKHFINELEAETAKLTSYQKQQAKQVCVDLTNDDDDYLAARKLSKADPKEKVDPNLLERVLKTKNEKFKEDFKNQIKNVKQFVSEHLDNHHSEPIRIEQYIDFDYFFTKLKQFLDEPCERKFRTNSNALQLYKFSNKQKKAYDEELLDSSDSSKPRKYTDFLSDTESTFILSSVNLNENERNNIFSKLSLNSTNPKTERNNNSKKRDEANSKNADKDESDEKENNDSLRNFKLRLCLSSDDVNLKEPSATKVVQSKQRSETTNNENSDCSDNSQNEDGDDEDSDSDSNSQNQTKDLTYLSNSTDNNSEIEEYTNAHENSEIIIDDDNVVTKKDDKEIEYNTLSDDSFIVLDETVGPEVESLNPQTSYLPILSKKNKMKRSISESILKNKSNADSKQLAICLGARVLALRDKAKHKWKEATIMRITECGQVISSPIRGYEYGITSKIIKAALYTVRFDSDDEEENSQDCETHQIPLFADDNYAENRVYDSQNNNNNNNLDSSSNTSDNEDSSHSDSNEERSTPCNRNPNSENLINKKKRKVDQKSSNQRQGKSNGRCKKRTMPNQQKNMTNKISLDSFKSSSKRDNGYVELKADSLAYLNGYENTVDDCLFNTRTQTIELKIRSRVVTYYQLVVKSSNSTLLFNSEYFCSGTIAELPAERNSYRYLIFFDNGFVCYAKPVQVFPIFDSFHLPEERLHLDHINFLHNYFAYYPERSMVVFGRDEDEIQSVSTYFFNRWFSGKVIDIDCSLVKIEIANKLTGIINGKEKGIMYTFSYQLYRGSYRIYPLYENFINNLLKHKHAIEKELDTIPTLNIYEKYIKSKYIDSHDNKLKYISLFTSTQFPMLDSKSKEAKELCLELIPVIDKTKVLQGAVKYLDLEANYIESTAPFIQHPCTRACVAKFENNIDTIKHINPLLVPILHGWQRLICIQKKTIRTTMKKWIAYQAPCGRTLRNTGEVDRYLNFTASMLTLDLFSFDSYININREYEANAKFFKIEDITYSSEKVPISCVNCVDTTEPDKIFYSAMRKPLEGVPLNATEDDLDGCNCTDNCRDRSKCACWRKTFEATLFGKDSEINTEVGYRGRRLPQMVNTGIFECNSKCKCDHRCSNKVVQNGISLRIQLFKTSQKGWGLRCLDDVPKGAFICTYAGLLMTEEQSDIRGAEDGDEYFAELDFLHCLRNLMKNSDDSINEDSDDSNSNEHDSDKNSESSSVKNKKNKKTKINVAPNTSSKLNDSYQRPKQQLKNTKKHNTLTSAASSNSNEDLKEFECIYLDSDEDEQDVSGRTQNLNSNQQEDEHNKSRALARQQKDKKTVTSIQSSRFFTSKENRFFYKDFLQCPQEAYIMDAKSWGNIGRWFNHSCSPNIFVQNVFIDTYDLKFPWIAFFAQQAIKAGTELCWNYNYTVGSVKGRVLYCHCNSANCTGRLL
jgi:histone-lysine N-methyltransferase SETDB1